MIRELEMDFSTGFQVLTGETGAGKSILIDSIGLLCGAKADKTLIRTGEEYACVEGTFGAFSQQAVKNLAEMDLPVDEEGKLLVQRYLYADGRGKIKVNGVAVTLASLKAISKYLVDIHGQTDTLALYDSTTYIHVLDTFASLDTALSAYKAAFDTYESLRREMDEINRGEAERLRTIEMLAYQVADIDALSLKPGEDEALEEKEKRIKNHERIYRQTNFAWRALKGAEKGNAALLLDRSAAAIETLGDVIPDAEKLAAEIRDCLYRIEDIADRIYDISESDEGDPTSLINKIELRLDAISKLKKKYGGTVAEILAYRASAAQRLENMQNADERLEELRAKVKTAKVEADKLALTLHNTRVAAAQTLSERVVETLVFLDMPKVSFRVEIAENKDSDGEYILSSDGFDSVEFLISANSGEQMHSLSKVASGGELARMMLALKSVENEKDNSTAMIFDEIDAGVSGKTARKIGMKLLELSRRTQIFCVTHSAQIASLADVHFLIAKHESEGRTVTTVTSLDEDGRILELSRILGGIHVTDAQRQAAIDMRGERGKI